MQSFDDQQKLINSGIYKDGLEALRAAAKELEKEEVKQWISVISVWSDLSLCARCNEA